MLYDSDAIEVRSLQKTYKLLYFKAKTLTNCFLTAYHLLTG